MLDREAATIQQDGTVIEDGRPVARIELFAASDPQALEPVGADPISPRGRVRWIQLAAR